MDKETKLHQQYHALSPNSVADHVDLQPQVTYRATTDALNYSFPKPTHDSLQVCLISSALLFVIIYSASFAD